MEPIPSRPGRTKAKMHMKPKREEKNGDQRIGLPMAWIEVNDGTLVRHGRKSGKTGVLCDTNIFGGGLVLRCMSLSVLYM